MIQARRTILIVDDSPEDRELYRRFLLKDETCVYHILEATNGRQGLALWQQHRPDILLLDYRLPDLDGLAFLGALECPTQRPCLPVVMLTGLGNEAIAVKAIKAGAQDYLVKGQIIPEGLHLAIEGAIESVRLHRELQQRIERERLVAQITQHIRRSLDLQTILQTTVDEVRQFLQTDRVILFRLEPDGSGTVVTESVGSAWQSILASNIHDPCFTEGYVEPYRQGLVTAKPDIYNGTIDPCHVELLARFQVKANLVVPILQDDQLWGLLIAHHCATPRQWQLLEVDLLKELANQVSIALQQAELYQRVQQELAERQQAEAALRQQTDRERLVTQIAQRIRQTLDLNEILQTTVAEVRQFLQTDRVFMYRFQPDFSGVVVVESVGEAWQPILHTEVEDLYSVDIRDEDYRQGCIQAVADIYSAGLTDRHVELLERFQVRANLAVPILHNEGLWGLLVANHCAAPRQWQSFEVDLLKQLAIQVGIALQQSELYQQAQNEIAERRLIEESLRQSEAFKERVLDSSADCIKVLDLEGRLVYMNGGGLCQMEIDDFAPFLHAEWTSFWQDEGYELAQSALAVAKAGKVSTFQGYCPTAKGTPKWWEVIVCPILDRAGNVERILSISRDVSDRIRFEQEREQILAQEQAARQVAERANRTKDEFLAVLSHELRSPLNPILGWAKLLQSRSFDASRTSEALAVIERNAKLQAQLIDDLLDISRIMSGKLALTSNPVDLPFVVLSALETVRLGAEAKQIHIEKSLEFESGLVLGDAARLQQVVWNLLSNAVKFTPAGGHITVQLVREMSGDAAFAKLSVTDNGKGIKPEFLPHLFEYFRQEDSSTTRRFGGLGLGLAIVRQIVEMHGGTVEAESQGEGQGATFTVRLPLRSHETAPQLAKLSSSRSSLAGSPALPLTGVQLLVVDDDLDNLNFYTVVLESSGAEVVAVSSAAEAMQHLSETTPDILVSDIGMPDTNGYVLMEQVKTAEATQGKQIPAIALTAYASDRDRELALAAGFRSHLAKPIEPDALVEAIAQLLGQLH
ncbi:GAF domain-containing protein [Leptolyngbya ohadii]|uniref:GAF domain-containing protein n=1 Tax=Leptolyngbya ohadii TaxID=1962290 RepID=UPI000B5990B9|nr:GAF domain-containing protein [Leptolyngbya ohadii]